MPSTAFNLSMKHTREMKSSELKNFFSGKVFSPFLSHLFRITVYIQVPYDRNLRTWMSAFWESGIIAAGSTSSFPPGTSVQLHRNLSFDGFISFTSESINCIDSSGPTFSDSTFLCSSCIWMCTGLRWKKNLFNKGTLQNPVVIISITQHVSDVCIKVCRSEGVVNHSEDHRWIIDVM